MPLSYEHYVDLCAYIKFIEEMKAQLQYDACIISTMTFTPQITVITNKK